MTKVQIDSMIEETKDCAFLHRVQYVDVGSKTAFGLSMALEYLKNLRDTAQEIAQLSFKDLPLYINCDKEFYKELIA